MGLQVKYSGMREWAFNPAVHVHIRTIGSREASVFLDTGTDEYIGVGERIGTSGDPGERPTQHTVPVEVFRFPRASLLKAHTIELPVVWTMAMLGVNPIVDLMKKVVEEEAPEEATLTGAERLRRAVRRGIPAPSPVQQGAPAQTSIRNNRWRVEGATTTSVIPPGLQEAVENEPAREVSEAPERFFNWTSTEDPLVFSNSRAPASVVTATEQQRRMSEEQQRVIRAAQERMYLNNPPTPRIPVPEEDPNF